MKTVKTFAINRAGSNLINACSAKTLEGNPHVRGFVVTPSAEGRRIPLISWMVKDYTLFPEELEGALLKACEVAGIEMPAPQTDQVSLLRIDPLGGAQDYEVGRMKIHRTCVGKFDVTGVPVYVSDLPAWFGLLAALKQPELPLALMIPLTIERRSAHGEIRSSIRLQGYWGRSEGGMAVLEDVDVAAGYSRLREVYVHQGWLGGYDMHGQVVVHLALQEFILQEGQDERRLYVALGTENS